MELISQHTKRIMEECKERARAAGLCFADETLEYIVTNKDLLELSPKVMIPTLYDYWVHDVEVLKELGKYKLYPHNPYETVINSRPAISYYNDNNPDWLNIMIFYHVLGHIDFFQNNTLFENTWNDDFVGQALADKRLIERLRGEHGRWVDYAIEFSRSIDNITGFFASLPKEHLYKNLEPSDRLNFYINVFLQEIKQVPQFEIYNEIERFNKLVVDNKDLAETIYFNEVKIKYPEFQSIFEKTNITTDEHQDLLEFVRENSPFLKKDKNSWMKLVMTIVRNTSLYFAPQMRTKIVNEGWASYWHDSLFRSDDRIKGHEVDYAKINAWVTSLNRIGLNPYAIGLRLLQHIEKLGNQGRIDYNFQRIENFEERKAFNTNINKGKEAIFNVRKNFSDFMLINTFVSQDFVDEYNLFVVGKRLNEQRGTVQYYIKSKKSQDYKNMLIESLYHPPKMRVDLNKTNENNLFIVHSFEKKQLYKDYIPDVLIGLEFLWGSQVQLATTEIVRKKDKKELELQPVVYTVKNKNISKVYL